MCHCRLRPRANALKQDPENTLLRGSWVARNAEDVAFPAGKEYTNADSRYATRDSFVVAMEAVTAFVEGPGCYAAVYGMLFQRPWVSAVQVLVSTGQLYGTVLYFITSLLEGGPIMVTGRL